MNRDFLLAVLCGLLVSLGIYWVLAPNWYVALATAAIYTGTGYFYFAFDISLLGEEIKFDDRTDRLGYAIGLFGLSVSPVALALHYGQQDEAMLPLVVSFMGVIAFLVFISKAQQQNEHTRIRER